jgi:hypothetical protein
LIPRLYLYLAAAGTLAASLAACYGFGFSHARHQAAIERAKIEAIAIATDARYRKLESEVASAQAAYVTSWTAARDTARADWLRLQATSRDRVPIVCSKSRSTDADRGHGLEAASGQGDRDLLPALIDALEQGERLEATLTLCQAELRQCASLR